VTASAAEKIYRSTGATTVIDQCLSIDADAALEFLPPETILFDGARLRRALRGRPHEPAFLHALGVYESLHGSSERALETLRLALRTERNPRWRRVVSREIARLRAVERAAALLAPRRAAV